MKLKRYQYAALVGSIAIILGLLPWMTTMARHEERPLVLSISSTESVYSTGKAIELNLRVSNVSGDAIDIRIPDAYLGTLRVFVSRDGHEYAEYVGPRWGAIDNFRKHKLESGASIDRKTTVLFNRTIETEHLMPLYAERLKKERIVTEFAIADAGHYWIKATYQNGKDIYSSEPIEFEITPPIGTDAVVWEQIKTDGAFAYMLHTGESKYLVGSDEAAVFNEKLGRLISNYSESDLGGRLSQQFTKYNRNLEYVKRLKAERETGR